MIREQRRALDLPTSAAHPYREPEEPERPHLRPIYDNQGRFAGYQDLRELPHMQGDRR